MSDLFRKLFLFASKFLDGNLTFLKQFEDGFFSKMLIFGELSALGGL